MKRLLFAIVSALIALSLSGKEVSRNDETGMRLMEVDGTYSLKGKGGVIVLGDLKTSRNFMVAANMAFTQKMLDTITCDDQVFNVKEDKTGLYITKSGLGLIKIRPSDTLTFLADLEWMILKSKGKRIWSILTE